MALFKKDKEINQIYETMKDHPNNKNLTEKEMRKKIKNVFNGSLSKFKTYMESISIDFTKYENRPQAYYWVAVMDNRYGAIKSPGVFVKSEGEKVVKHILDLLFTEESFLVRNEAVKSFLNENGIILRNSEFIQGSNINGCILNKEGQIFIYINDKQKREYQYIYTLATELQYLYTGKNDNTAELIKYYEKKFNKSHKELDLAMSIFESDELIEMKWELLRVQTKKKINFRLVNSGF